MFKPKVVEEIDSKHNGKLKVISTFGSKYVATGFLTQSGGLVKDVWDPILKKFGEKNKTWLILGLATGTVAQIISQKFNPSWMVGIEIDPIMLELGSRHFNLDQIPSLEIVNQDAQKYMARAPEFDFILVDLYVNDKLPEFVYSPKFVSQLKKSLLPSGRVIVNHLFYDDTKRHNAKQLINLLEKNFDSVELERKLTNILIVCS